MSRREKYPERNAEIRKLYAAGGITMAELGRRYGVSETAIYCVLNPEINRANYRRTYAQRYGIDDSFTERLRQAVKKHNEKKKMEARS